VFDRRTGKPLGPLPGGGANGVAGGCFAVVADDSVLYSAGETWGILAGSPEKNEKVVFADGQRVVADGRMSYVLAKDRLYAIDRAHWLELGRLQAKAKKTAEDQARIAALGGTRRDYVKWDIPCAHAYELIVAGGTIFLGELNRVTGYHPSDGRKLWEGDVRGKAYGLAASDGGLYVSTDLGVVHCFQTGVPRPSGPHTFEFVEAASKPSPYPSDAQSLLYSQTAQTAIERAGTTKGYCLVLGAGKGRLAYAIAQRSQFQVLCIEPDAANVAEARRRMAEAGLYGTRVTVHEGGAAKLPFPRYWANLIVSDETLRCGKLPDSPAEIHRVLRPCGGCLVLIAPEATAREGLTEWGRAIPGWKVERFGAGLMASALRGPLPGAGEWSHFHADPGNTACSGDAMKSGPVDLQWFGAPGPRNMPDRHDKNVAPACKNGRLFVSGDNYAVAVDAYNGTVLWQREVPRSVRLGAFKHSGSMAATDDRLYIASASECLALDAQGGEIRQTFGVPASPHGRANEWGYVGVDNDLLLGSVTRPGASRPDDRHGSADLARLHARGYQRRGLLA
jgi:SAM-dependent methyltransferase